jgi:hypothetical protein
MDDAGYRRSGRRWSDGERDKAIQLVVQGSRSLDYVGRYLGRSASGVANQLWKAGYRGVTGDGPQKSGRIYMVDADDVPTMLPRGQALEERVSRLEEEARKPRGFLQWWTRPMRGGIGKSYLRGGEDNG